MNSIKNIDKQYVANTYNRFPVEIVNGKGSYVYDETGKEYIDMASGIAVTSFGIADEVWKNAIIEQLNKVQHMSNLYYTEPCALLAQKLCAKTGMAKVFFCNSGAEANEGAIKVARKYAADHKGPEYSTIITMKNSFHGRTLTTLAATGQEHYHELFQPLTPGFIHADINDLAGLKKMVEENKVAAIMLEVIQGEGGVIELDKDFIEGINTLAKEKDIIIIIDEVQTGNGRTGKLYGYMHYAIQPDVVSTAKGIGGGLPLGAVLMSEKVENVLGYGDHGSTFGGNPIACAGANTIIDRLSDEFLQEVEKKGNYIKKSLENAEGVISISGKGLILGIKTVKPASEVVKTCMENGVLVITAKDKVRLLPALNIPMEALEKAVEVIKNAIK
ncbi:MAG: acetylornithine/succinylornithine family transaminase [Erysipelotrichaceae bacterium]|nr:acetylornithine/succinylornithine family transaminase [Erysipelotrichaceae bacterium]